MALNHKKLETHLDSIEAAARLMLSEAKSVRAMIDVPVKPQKIDTTRINYYRRMEKILKKPCGKQG